MIQIIFEESEKAIHTAYEEGYKEAFVQLQPQIEYMQHLCEKQKKDLKLSKIKNFSIGFLAGVLLPGTIYLGVKFYR